MTNKLAIAVLVLAFVAAFWFFELRPFVACVERGGNAIRGMFDNVVCVEAR